MELTDAVRALLERGSTILIELERGLRHHVDDDEIRALWELHGEQITREWAAKYPGSRPYHWWTFDAPEKRLCLGGVHWFDDPTWKAAVAEAHAEYPDIYGVVGGYYGLSRGVPRIWSRELASNAAGDDFETEAEFLTRLGLWLPGECERWESLPPENDADDEE
ncbi:MAG: hypothetical protein J5J06_02930 [Phycisphaerae bacterium]|nr:hypothetical protein [Phycisphaerae bacterium]